MSLWFANPGWLLLFVPLLLVAWRSRRRAPAHFSLPFEPNALNGQSWRTRVHPLLSGLPWLALALLVLAMARPQRRWQEERVTSEGIDIAVAMDISPSMLSKDFSPDRLTVAKRVAAEFVDKRPHDRLAVVAFSAGAFTQCPLTIDHEVVRSALGSLEVGRLEDGTAIGMGLATALNRLKDSRSPSRIVILITDGENMGGYISPEQAAELAVDLGVRVYTIGVGTEGIVMSPSSRNFDGSYNFSPRPVKFNTELLENIAARTGGRFFRARSGADLEAIYADIDRMEKVEIEVGREARHQDYFGWLIAGALVLLALEAVSRWLVLRSIRL